MTPAPAQSAPVTESPAELNQTATMPSTGELPAVPAAEADRLGKGGESQVDRWMASLRRDPVTPKLVIVATTCLVVGALVGALLGRAIGGGSAGVADVGASPTVGPVEGLDSAMPCGSGQFVAFIAAVGPPEAYVQAVGTLYTQMAKTSGSEYEPDQLRLTLGSDLCAEAAEGYTDMAKRADWYFIWAGPFSKSEDADAWCSAMGYRQLGKDCLVKSTGG